MESKFDKQQRFRRWVIHVMVDNDCWPMTIGEIGVAMSRKWKQTPTTKELGMILSMMGCMKHNVNEANPSKGGTWQIR